MCEIETTVNAEEMKLITLYRRMTTADKQLALVLCNRLSLNKVTNTTVTGNVETDNICLSGNSVVAIGKITTK